MKWLKSIGVLLVLSIGVCIVANIDCYGAVTGSGKSQSPYVVKNEKDLNEALGYAKDGVNMYIDIAKDITITNIVRVEKGLVHINAQGVDRKIKKGIGWTAPINDTDNPRKMIRISNGAELYMGERGSTLAIVGARGAFPDNRQQNDTFCVDNNSSLVLDKNTMLKDAQNSMNMAESAPIRVYGNLTVRCEITNCYGGNGGAIKNLGGIVNIEDGANIHNCYSYTEGGAIYVGEQGALNMGGDSKITDCFAEEEGGAIFATEESDCRIESGLIYQNRAGKSSGGIFSGYGAKLIIGFNGKGPLISHNTAELAGGGIRCNGGSGKGGGSALFRGGTITDNKSLDNGGGISIGAGSSKYKSIVNIDSMFITNNSAVSYGGGIYVSANVEGIGGNMMKVSNTTISYNTSEASGGGLFLIGSVSFSSHNIIHNKATNNGGGMAIVETGKAVIDDGTISANYSARGAGIYQNGLLEFKKNAFVNNSNMVYLCKDRHIDVIEPLAKTSGYVARVEAAITSPGTIIVDVDYKDSMASKELYYSGTPESERKGEKVEKKFVVAGDIPLRDATNIKGINNKRYIIISRLYDIKYHSNSLDPVANFPEDENGFWNEYVAVVSTNITRDGFVLNTDMTWNTTAQGDGLAYKSGKILVDSNIDLYAIWNEIAIKELFMKAQDRYYAVDQNIVLDRDELTRKVVVTNDQKTAVTYFVRVIRIEDNEGRLIAKGSNLSTQNYINTKESATYTLTLQATSYSGDVTVTEQMNVYILEGLYKHTEVRFISYEFIDTVAPFSIWKEELYEELERSLKSDSETYEYEVELTYEDIQTAQASVRKKKYKITKKENKQFSGKIKKVVKE